MPYEIYIRLLDRTGAIKRSAIFPRRLRFSRDRRRIMPFYFDLEVGNRDALSIEHYDYIDVQIRNLELGIKDYTPGDSFGGFVHCFLGIVQDFQYTTDSDGISVIRFSGLDHKAILSWRRVLWPAGVANRSSFTAVPAETVGKTLVDYNTTTNATTGNGRFRDGDLLAGMGYTISIEADAAGGSNITDTFFNKGLWTALVAVVEAGGGDFSLEWGGVGTSSFTFKYHAGQLGTDKTTGANRVVFSVDSPYRNMINPVKKVINSIRPTAFLIAGGGEGEDRFTQTVTSGDYAANNDKETFIDARDLYTSAQLTSRGQEKIDRLRKLNEFDFGVLQTAAYFWSPVDVAGSKTYDYGDKVKSVYFGDEDKIIERITLNLVPPTNDDPVLITVFTESVT